MENKYHPSKDPIRAGEIAIVNKALNEYLSLCSDDIADLVYEFFRTFNSEGPQVFTIGVAKALKIFATEKKSETLSDIEVRMAISFSALYFKNVITFCSDISSKEANGIRMQKSEWEIGYVFRGNYNGKEEV